MESSNELYQIFTSIATQLPSLLTMLGGIVVALTRWKRHPRVSLTIVIGLGLLLLHALVFAVVYAVLPTLVGPAYERLQTVHTLVSVAYNFSLAIFTTILIAAVFVQRKEQPPPPPLYEQVAEARAA